MSAKRKELDERVGQLRLEIAALRHDLTGEVNELDRRRHAALHRLQNIALAGAGVGLSLMALKLVFAALAGLLNQLPRRKS